MYLDKHASLTTVSFDHKSEFVICTTNVLCITWRWNFLKPVRSFFEPICWKQLCLYACKLLTFKKTSPWRIPIVRVAVIWLQPHIPFPNIRGRESVPHYNDVIMGAIASQITSLTIVLTTVYADAEQRKHQSSASLVFVRGIHPGPMDSPHKWPVTRKCFHLMTSSWLQPATRRDRWLPPTKGKFYALWLTTHFPYHWPFMGWLHL